MTMTMDVCLCLYTVNYPKKAYLNIHAPFAVFRCPHDIYIPFRSQVAFHSQIAFRTELRVGLCWFGLNGPWVGF